jgi:hypothetical protein
MADWALDDIGCTSGSCVTVDIITEDGTAGVGVGLGVSTDGDGEDDGMLNGAPIDTVVDGGADHPFALPRSPSPEPSGSMPMCFRCGGSVDQGGGGGGWSGVSWRCECRCGSCGAMVGDDKALGLCSSFG